MSNKIFYPKQEINNIKTLETAKEEALNWYELWEKSEKERVKFQTDFLIITENEKHWRRRAEELERLLSKY